MRLACPSRSGVMQPFQRQTVVTALRSFLRYTQFHGKVTAGLALGMPAVAGWTSTPKSNGPSRPNTHSAQLTVATVRLRGAMRSRRAADSGVTGATSLRDRQADAGRRRLGPRSIACVWKGGRESFLPSTADVGEAIAAYLRHGRPKSPDRYLFFRSVAPRRGLMEGSDGIGTIVRHALNRA
jgi:integrase/recombinase XerD